MMLPQETTEDACYRTFCRLQRANGRVSGMSDLTGIMEALTDPNINIIGLCAHDDDHMANNLETVIRRVKRDGLYGVIVMVSIRQNPNLRRIQDEIAHQLGFSFQRKGKSISFRAVFPIKTKNKKALAKNARELSDRIRTGSKFLFILRDLHSGLDLAKLGVADHQFCKLIVTSHSEEILSKHMNAQRTFKL